MDPDSDPSEVDVSFFPRLRICTIVRSSVFQIFGVRKGRLEFVQCESGGDIVLDGVPEVERVSILSCPSFSWNGMKHLTSSLSVLEIHDSLRTIPDFGLDSSSYVDFLFFSISNSHARSKSASFVCSSFFFSFLVKLVWIFIFTVISLMNIKSFPHTDVF